jgi:hypothetical protein
MVAALPFCLHRWRPRQDVVKLGDFGISTSLQAGEMAKTLAGTPQVR